MTDRETDVLVRRVAGESQDLLAPGTVVGSWRISSLIAAGGCGVVYAARHPVLDRMAAVKVLHAELTQSQEMVDRFVQEARAVNRIRHPNIVDVFDFGTFHDGRPFFVMELLSPDDLEDCIEAAGRFTLDEIMAIVPPICDALDAAHRAGYIHRDLKARNIGFATTVQGVATPKLLDFGIAKLLEEDRDGVTCTVRVGTPHCMAPEQIRGERIDVRTDIYALGVLLHQLLTGCWPFDAATALEVERMHLDAPAPPPSRLAPVPLAIDAVVLRALAKRPADRQSSVRELLDELVAAVEEGGAPAAIAHDEQDALTIRVAVSVPDECDEDDVDDAAAAIEHARELLSAAGFIPVVITSTSIIAARAIDDDRHRSQETATALVSKLERSLDTRPSRRRGVATKVEMQTGTTQISKSTGT